jgi:hypothetical protein
MNFVDSIFVRFADPGLRAALFDDVTLAQLVSAAYDPAALDVGGPFTPIFDDVQLGVGASVIGRMDGAWGVSGASVRTEARFDFAGFGILPTVRVDALWRGAIVARTTPDTAPVSAVDFDWVALGGIDSEIIAALGALPTQPDVLETERRTRLGQRLAQSFAQPTLVTPERVDQWLRDVGASTAGEFLSSMATVTRPAHARLTFARPSDVATPRRLPMTVGFLIRDAGFSLSELVWESRLARDRLEPSGVERPRNGAPRPHHSIVIGWVVPATVFDDTDWPGATRDARRAAAGQWLAREGIGLVVI